MKATIKTLNIPQDNKFLFDTICEDDDFAICKSDLYNSLKTKQKGILLDSYGDFEDVSYMFKTINFKNSSFCAMKLLHNSKDDSANIEFLESFAEALHPETEIRFAARPDINIPIGYCRCMVVVT